MFLHTFQNIVHLFGQKIASFGRREWIMVDITLSRTGPSTVIEALRRCIYYIYIFMYIYNIHTIYRGERGTRGTVGQQAFSKKPTEE